MATRQLAAFACGVEHAALPPTVRARVKTLLLDTVGNCIRGRYEAQCTPSLLRAAGALGAAGGTGRVIGCGASQYTPAVAALINGTLAHSLDFDGAAAAPTLGHSFTRYSDGACRPTDTHSAGSIHNSAPVIPAALAAAELADSSGADLIAAITAGFETMIRLRSPPRHRPSRRSVRACCAPGARSGRRGG
jgi:2-methylcitrate dehydratase PrpD